MSILVENFPAVSGNIQLVFNIIFTVLIVLLLRYLLPVYFKRRRLVNQVNQLPYFQLKFYHFLGHYKDAVKYRIWKRQHSADVYDIQHFLGLLEMHKHIGHTVFWLVYQPVVVIMKADIAEIILSSSVEIEKAFFYKFLHPWLGMGLLTSFGEKWKNRRKLLTPAFHFNILQNFIPTFNKQSQILIQILESYTNKDYIDIVPFTALCSLDIICESTLGTQLHAQTKQGIPYVKSVTGLSDDTFKRSVKPWLWPDILFKISLLGRSYYKHKQILQDFTNKVIWRRKEEKLEKLDQEVHEEESYIRKKRALLDLLLAEHLKGNNLSEKEIREEVDTFTFEGHDTTSVAMSFTLYLIGLYPEVQKKIQEELDSIFGDDDREIISDDFAEMKYLERVIKESLRLYPPVPFFGRLLQEDVIYKGHIFPKGSSCAISSYTLHRDPNEFPNPDEFDPDRFLPENIATRNPFAYVPFSAGPRNCIGQRFAMMEMKTVLSYILRKFQLCSIEPRDQIQIIDHIVLRSLYGLKIQIRKRERCEV